MHNTYLYYVGTPVETCFSHHRNLLKLLVTRIRVTINNSFLGPT